jgi:hypothetical protein
MSTDYQLSPSNNLLAANPRSAVRTTRCHLRQRTMLTFAAILDWIFVATWLAEHGSKEREYRALTQYDAKVCALSIIGYKMFI